MYDNMIAKILFITGVAQITIGIFTGLVFGTANADYSGQFSWALFFTWSVGGFILGVLFIGFAENIQLLQRIYSKMSNEDNVEINSEHDQFTEKPFDLNDWFLPEDKEKIEDFYKNETIVEIVPSTIEGYCIVKLQYDSDQYVRVVDIQGFGVSEVKDGETKGYIITWYNKQP